MMEFNTTSGGFQSRRSYPSLRHISLAPLTPRFPIDDDSDITDYFNQSDHVAPASGTRTPPASSYLSSVSVPSTPPILSHSRSNSRSRHKRSKSSTGTGALSDTNLHNRELGQALHHIPNTKKHPSISHSQGRRPLPDSTPKSKSDAEWMLRAGIALASSTREEKGQSWLSKRETSTTLVPDTSFDETPTNRHHHRTRSGASSRISRSGASTPGGAGALSRRSSRSRAGSRPGSSRVHLTMTALSAVPVSAENGVSISSGTDTGTVTRTASPEARGRSPLVPDFVDAHIRAEMASLQHRERGFSDEDSMYWDGAGSDEDETWSVYSGGSDEMPDDFDEADLQQLTRERGFGLGSWIDQFVEWTLFGVDEWPAAVPDVVPASRIGTADTSTTVTFEEPVFVDGRADDSVSLGSAGDKDLSDDGESSTGTAAPIENPGTQGGWEDAGWLLRLMKRALV
ncbi:unnamed protein product [Penicillium nalgiovense]|nr:unnamed protein product [Penicillium nalgiovense]